MAITYVEHTTRRVNISPWAAVTVSSTPALTDWTGTSGVDFEQLPGVTGVTVNLNHNNEQWSEVDGTGDRYSLATTRQLTMQLTLKYRIDDATEALDATHQDLVNAANKSNTGNLVWVRYDFPVAAASAKSASDNIPTDGRILVFAASVTGGEGGAGGGGSMGGYENSQYTLTSFGARYIIDI